MDSGLKAKLLEKLIDDLHLAPSAMGEVEGEALDLPADEEDEEKKRKKLLSISIEQGNDELPEE